MIRFLHLFCFCLYKALGLNQTGFVCIIKYIFKSLFSLILNNSCLTHMKLLYSFIHFHLAVFLLIIISTGEHRHIVLFIYIIIWSQYCNNLFLVFKRKLLLPQLYEVNGKTTKQMTAGLVEQIERKIAYNIETGNKCMLYRRLWTTRTRTGLDLR